MVAECERLKQWVNDLQSGMYINCVYCGHRYGHSDEIPASLRGRIPEDKPPQDMADILTAHIEQCPEHPMSKLKKENEKLKKENKRLKETEDNGHNGCPECGYGYCPKPIEVDENMRQLVMWSDGIALDDYGDGLHRMIAGKLRTEDPDPAPESRARVPESLKASLRRFQAMDEETQDRVCFAVLGE